MPPIRPNNTFISQAANYGNQETENNFTANPFRTLAIICLFISIFISLTSFGILKYFESKNTDKENRISMIESEISKMPLEEMLSFYNKTLSINNQLNLHYSLTTQLNTLSDAVAKNVYFKSFNFIVKAASSSDLELVGVASDEADIVRQMDLFKSDKYLQFIKNVNLLSVKKEDDKGVSFNMKLTVNPKVRPDYIILGVLDKNQDIKYTAPKPTSTPESINNLNMLQNISTSTIINNILNNLNNKSTSSLNSSTTKN